MNYRILSLLLLILMVQPLWATSLEDAEYAFAVGDYQAAIEAYSRYLEDHPSSYEALFGLARSLAFTGKRAAAINVLDTLLTLNPDDADAHLMRGRIYGWEKHFVKADEDLRFVTERYPAYADAWSALGDLFFWRNRPEEAARSYSMEIALQPDLPDAYIARAKALINIRLFNSARTDLEEAIKLDGDEFEIERLLHRILRDQAADWEATLSFNTSSFTPKRSTSTMFEGSAKHEFGFGSMALGFTQVKRWDEWDNALLLDGYIDTWNLAYANIQMRYALSSNSLPEMEYLAEIFQGIGSSWEVSAGFLLKQYPSNYTDIYILSVARYIGAFYLRERIYINPEVEGTSQTHLLTARWYPGKIDDYLEVNLGLSNTREYTFEGWEMSPEYEWIEISTSDRNPDFEGTQPKIGDNLLQTLLCEVTVQRFLDPRIGMLVSCTYKHEHEGKVIRDLKLKLVYRW